MVGLCTELRDAYGTYVEDIGAMMTSSIKTAMMGVRVITNLGDDGAELDAEAVKEQISAAFDTPAEAGETLSQEADGEESKRMLIFNGLKDAGLTGVQALRVLGALKAQG